MPTSLPFQPAAGSQTSTLMSESGVGARVAWMRQNAGKPLKPWAATPGGGPNGVAGGVKPPAGTRVAAVTLPSGTAAPARSPQSLAAAGAAIASSPTRANGAAAAANLMPDMMSPPLAYSVQPAGDCAPGRI